MGAESKFFNGHTNITDDGFITFGVKGLLQASRSLKNALLFNVLSFMSDVLLTQGNTAASLDEFYLFLSNLTAVEYVRNFMKRVRKKMCIRDRVCGKPWRMLSFPQSMIIMQVCIMESGRDILAAMFPLEREAGKKI